MENNVKKIYFFDCAILVGLSALLVFIISYVLYSLGQVPNGESVRAAIMASGLLAILFALTGMATVMLHLRQNSSELYAGSIEMQRIHLQIDSIESEAL
jgi:heme A synthase